MPANLDESQDISDIDMRVLMAPSPEQLRESIEFTAELRETDDPFDVIASGITYGLDKDTATSKVQSYQDVGATWWMEWLDCSTPGSLADMRAFIEAGPPGA